MLPAGLALVPPRRGRLPARLPATEAWLTALAGPDGRFDADPGELGALAAGLAPWEDVGTGQTGPGPGDVPAGRGPGRGRIVSGAPGTRCAGSRMGRGTDRAAAGV